MNKNLSFSVSAQRIELTDAAMLVAGTVNEYTARFTFDESWDGYQRTAVFYCNTVEREQLLTDDACTVPWEVLVANGYLRVGVYGTKDGSRLPTIWTERRLYINPGAGPTQEAADPSPTLVEQLMARMGDLAALKTEDKSSLVAAINEVWSSGGSGGASVTDAAINEDGHLIITLSTGKQIDAGYAVGPAGATGAAGKDGQDGAPGKDGAAGAPGKDGVGIQSVDQTTTSTDDGGTNIITVTKSDGTSSTFQVRNGSKGSTGPAGADGAPGKDGLGVPVATSEDAGKVPVVQADGSYELGSQISPPETAKVGQTIVVKTVDADGKPTEWEAADMASGGGSGGGIHLIARVVTEANAASIEVTGLSTTAEVLSLRIYNPGSNCGAGLCITVNGVRKYGYMGSIKGANIEAASVRAWLYRDGDTLHGRARMENEATNVYEWPEMEEITSIAVDSLYNDGTTKYFQAGTIFEIYEGMYPNVA